MYFHSRLTDADTLRLQPHAVTEYPVRYRSCRTSHDSPRSAGPDPDLRLTVLIGHVFIPNETVDITGSTYLMLQVACLVPAGWEDEI